MTVMKQVVMHLDDPHYLEILRVNGKLLSTITRSLILAFEI